ncbi:hypothetical protein R50072_25410 [Simiduia litorea]
MKLSEFIKRNFLCAATQLAHPAWAFYVQGWTVSERRQDADSDSPRQSATKQQRA